jgi:hypothetical protein
MGAEEAQMADDRINMDTDETIGRATEEEAVGREDREEEFEDADELDEAIEESDE